MLFIQFNIFESFWRILSTFTHLNTEIQAQCAEDKQMNGIKPIGEHFALLTPLAVICKRKSEAHKRPRLGVHRSVAEWKRNRRTAVKQIEKVAD